MNERPRTADPLRAESDLPLWVTTILRGALLTLFGLVALLFPFATLFSLAVLMGTLLIGDGLISVWRAVRKYRKGASGATSWLVRGAISFLFGIALLATPLFATFAFATVALAIIASWLIWLGLVDLRLGFGAGQTIMIWWSALFLLAGIALLVLLFSTLASVLALAWLLAIAGIFAGLTMLSRGLMLRAAVRRA